MLTKRQTGAFRENWCRTPPNGWKLLEKLKKVWPKIVLAKIFLFFEILDLQNLPIWCQNRPKVDLHETWCTDTHLANFGGPISRKIENFSPRKFIFILFLFFPTTSIHWKVFRTSFLEDKNFRFFPIFFFFTSFWQHIAHFRLVFLIVSGRISKKKNLESLKTI